MVFDVSLRRRLTGAGALGIAVLYLVALALASPASTPASDASGAEVLRFLGAHRAGILAAVALNGLAWCALMPAVFVGLRSLIVGAGRGAATVACVAAAVEAALIGVALVFIATAAYAAPDLDVRSAKLFDNGFEIALVASAWPNITCALALVFAARRSRALPAPVVLVGVVVIALHAVSAVSFARAGAFSPGGIAAVAPPMFAVWMAVVGFCVLRGPVRSTARVAVAS
jgi:hypothetical protein